MRVFITIFLVLLVITFFAAFLYTNNMTIFLISAIIDIVAIFYIGDDIVARINGDKT